MPHLKREQRTMHPNCTAASRIGTHGLRANYCVPLVGNAST